MSDEMDRRQFLTRGWKAGVGMVGVAGVWTSWDVLQPRDTGGLGGIVKTVPESEVVEGTMLYVRAAQSYLTRQDGEILALWQRCPHLGCRVAWCDSSGEFECPCHGSTFNRIGEHRDGPSPSGMQQFAVTVVDGVVEVDTGTVSAGPPLGPESIDEPPLGPGCSGGDE